MPSQGRRCERRPTARTGTNSPQRTLCPRRRNGFSGRVTASGNVAVEKLAAPQLRNFWPVSQCDWPIDRGCLPSLPALSDPPTAEEQAAYDIALAQRNAAEDLAVYVLWALSGRQFGVCPVITRPCPPRRNLDRYQYDWPITAFYGLSELDRYQLVSGCGCAGWCRDGGPSMLHLPGPVQSVTAVTINGVVLDDDEYRLQGDVLYRLGGIWPSQDLGRPAGEDGTWTVEYMQGTPPPAGTAKLVGLLAKEFIAACTDGKCRLPRNVTNVSRQGVSFDMFNPNDIYDSGKTGLPEVDMWLAAVNPHHLACAPEVL